MASPDGSPAATTAAAATDLATAFAPADVIQAVRGPAQDLLQGLTPLGGVLLRQRVEQVKGIVVVERARSPGAHPARLS